MKNSKIIWPEVIIKLGRFFAIIGFFLVGIGIIINKDLGFDHYYDYKSKLLLSGTIILFLSLLCLVFGIKSEKGKVERFFKFF